MRLHPRLIPAVLASVLIGAAPAAGSTMISGTQIASSSAGSVVAWTETPDGGADGVPDGDSLLRVARAPLGGRFGPAETVLRVPASVSVTGAAISETGEALVTWVRIPNARPDEGGPPRGRVEASLAAPGGRFGPVIDLSGGPAAPYPGVVTAMSRNGHAGVAWEQDGATRVALRGPGAPFGAPATVAQRTTVSLGLAGDGEAVLGGVAACAEFSCPFAVATRAAGGPFGTPQDLGPETLTRDGQTVAIGGRGGVVAVHADSPQGGLAASRRARGAERFSPPERLADEVSGPVVAGVADSGEAVVLWPPTVRAGAGLMAAHAGAGEPFGAPQTLDTARNVAGVQLEVEPNGGATAVWSSDRAIRLARRGAGEAFGPAMAVEGTGLDQAVDLGASNGTAVLALTRSDSDYRSLSVATVSPTGAVDVQTLAEFRPTPERAVATIPDAARSILQRGRRLRVPVSCSLEGPSCSGRVLVRSGRRTSTAPYRVDRGTGRWVWVRTTRGLRRVVVEVRESGRRTDRRRLAVRRRLAPGCPRPLWAHVLDRRAGVVVSSFSRPDPDAEEPEITLTTVSACRVGGGRPATLRTMRNGPFEGLDAVSGAWAGARTVALAEAQAPYRGGSTVSVALYDAGSGRRLGRAVIGTIDETVTYPPAREVRRVVFTRGGRAVYAAQVGGDVRIGVLERDGDHRVLDEGPDVEARSLRSTGATVTWTRGGRQVVHR